MGEPVMPAVLHTTKNVKKAADVSSALEASKGWAGRPSELAQWRDASQSPATEDTTNEDAALALEEAEGRKVTDAFATDGMPQGDADLTADAPVFREDASDYGEDWTEEVEPEAADASLTAQEPVEGMNGTKSPKMTRRLRLSGMCRLMSRSFEPLWIAKPPRQRHRAIALISVIWTKLFWTKTCCENWCPTLSETS